MPHSIPSPSPQHNGPMTKLRELISDESHHLSSARVGLWATVLESFVVVGVDVGLSLARFPTHIPNTVYVLLGTQFTVFAGWAAGPRIAKYLLPQIGQIAQGIGAANRDQPPFPGMDRGEDGP